LAVVERRLEEVHTLGAVAGGCPRGVADEHVDLARLERGEAVLGGDVDELDLRGIAQHGRGDDPAEVGVKADVLAGRIQHCKPG
jgi:hypothetical protein